MTQSIIGATNGLVTSDVRNGNHQSARCAIHVDAWTDPRGGIQSYFLTPRRNDVSNQSSSGSGIVIVAAFYALAVGTIIGVLYAVTRSASWQTVAMTGWAVVVIVVSIALLFIARRHMSDS